MTSDACKFPHILPESGEQMPNNGPSKYASRSRTQSMYNLGAANENLNEKLANLNLRNVGKKSFFTAPVFIILLNT